jgi:hypothetical protein
MVRQHFGRPASSAGVERMYVQQGRQASRRDLKASQADDTLEHALLAGANLQWQPDAGVDAWTRAMRDPGTAEAGVAHGTRGWRSETRQAP